MSNLYDTDAVTWAKQQAALLRRLAAGERVNDQVDWENVVEEIEDVGRPRARQGDRGARPGAATQALPDRLATFDAGTPLGRPRCGSISPRRGGDSATACANT